MVRIHAAVRAGLVLVLAYGAFAQKALPEFEGLEIQADRMARAPMAEIRRNGQITFRAQPMRTLITFAYKEVYSDDYIKGAPDWFTTDHFNISGKAPKGASQDTVRLMFQQVLKKHFHLVTHWQHKTMPVYVLVAAKDAPKLTDSNGQFDAECAFRRTPDNVYHRLCSNVSMAKLAELLPGFGPLLAEPRPIVDMTGVKGSYDFQLDWTPAPPDNADQISKPSDAAGQPILAALEKTLGVRLEARKRSMPILVIDKCDRKPEEY